MMFMRERRTQVADGRRPVDDGGSQNGSRGGIDGMEIWDVTSFTLKNVKVSGMFRNTHAFPALLPERWTSARGVEIARIIQQVIWMVKKKTSNKGE
jgi:hypothetical protein